MASTAVSILLKATDSASAIFQRAAGTIGGSVQRIAGHATSTLTPALEKVRSQVAKNAAVFAADFPRAAAIAGTAYATIGAGATAMATKLSTESRVAAAGARIIGQSMTAGLGAAGRAMRTATGDIVSGAGTIAGAALRGFKATAGAAASTMGRVASLTASGFAAAGKAAVAGMARLRSAAVSGFHAAGNAAAGFGKKLVSLMTGPLAQLAGAFAIGAAIKKSIDAFAGAEERAHRLGIALKLNGEDAATTVPKLQGYAREIANVTTLSVGASMKLMEMGARLRIPSGALKDATKAAIGLSTVLGIDQEQALQKVNQAMNGNFKSLQKYIPQLRNAKNDAEKLAIVQKFAAGGFEMAKGKTETLAGSLERFGNLTHSVFKKIGGIIGPVVQQFVAKFAEKLPAIEAMLDNVAAWFTAMRAKLQPVFTAITEHGQRLWAVFSVVFQSIKTILTSFDSKMSETGGIVGTAASVITAVSNFMAKGIITAFTLVETIVTDWQRVWKLAITTVTLAIVMYVEDIKHTFGTVIPAYLSWFANNWKQVFADVFWGSLTVVKNFGKMLGDMISHIWQFVTSGMKGGIGGLLSNLARDANKSLLEGFTATAEKLPDILARKMTSEEKRLADEAAKLGSAVGGAFNEKLNQRLAGLSNAMADAAKSAADKTKKELDAINLDSLGAKKDKEKKAEEKTHNKAEESRLLTRGVASDPTLALAKEQLDLAKKAAADRKAQHKEQIEALNNIAAKQDNYVALEIR